MSKILLSAFVRLGHLLVCKLKNFGSWVYQLMIQSIVVFSLFLQDYISFIFSLVFFFLVFSFGVVVFLSFRVNPSFLSSESAIEGVTGFLVSQVRF